MWTEVYVGGRMLFRLFCIFHVEKKSLKKSTFYNKKYNQRLRLTEWYWYKVSGRKLFSILDLGHRLGLVGL